jgi:15-cis-phytoene synthase
MFYNVSMSLVLAEWEQQLINLATPDRHAQVGHGHTSQRDRDEELLHWAYGYCDRVTSIHSRSFYMASRFLPAEKRRSVRALYSFCRTTDDIVDFPADNVEQCLDDWHQRALNWTADTDDLVPLAWGDTCRRYHIPRVYAEQLIDGVKRDLYQTRYQTFNELAEYCYGVASTVGLMSMHIIGYESEQAKPYAIRLGVALQLTNICRDVAEDWTRGRLYFPLDELTAFGLSEDDIARGLVTERWREFMRFQIERARRLYRDAWPGISLLAKDGRTAIAAAAGFYAAILDDIEAHDYDVFSRRAYVSGWDKARLVPELVWRTLIKPAAPVFVRGEPSNG